MGEKKESIRRESIYQVELRRGFSFSLFEFFQKNKEKISFSFKPIKKIDYKYCRREKNLNTWPEENKSSYLTVSICPDLAAS